MKIALLSQNVSPGLLIFRKDLIKQLVSQGHEVYAFASDFTENNKKELQQLGATPVDYPLERAGINPIKDFYNWVKLYRQLKLVAPEVILCFFIKPSIYGILAAKIAGVKRRFAMIEGLGYAFTPDINGFSRKKQVLQRVLGLLMTISFRYADRVFFLNKDDPKDVLIQARIKQEKIVSFGPIGINLDEFPFFNIEDSKPLRFIFVARLLKEKGVYEFIKAAKIVKNSCSQVEFVLLGGLDEENPSGLSLQELEDLIADNTVIYAGYVKNVAEWISQSHVFVLPSYREGMPRSTQEAMSIGRAIITTDVPGCRETVNDGINGFLVPAYDHKVLAEKMLYLAENPEEVASMGKESHKMAKENFDSNKINMKLINYILY